MAQLQVAVSNVLQVDVIDTWAVWIQAAAAAATSIGLVTAGIWALVRFRRGRVFMRRCSIELECSATKMRGKSAICVNVLVRNCGDTRLTFETTDIAGIEVSTIRLEDWHNLQEGRWVQWSDEQNSGQNDDLLEKVWENKDWKMTEDLLMDCGGRFWPVSLEPNQDMARSCLFVMPQRWVAARVRCVFALGEEHNPRWIATRVVLQPAFDNSVRSTQADHFSKKKIEV